MPSNHGNAPGAAVAECRALRERDRERLGRKFVGDVDAGATVDVAVNRIKVLIEDGDEGVWDVEGAFKRFRVS
jgi:hypothetical protein